MVAAAAPAKCPKHRIYPQTGYMHEVTGQHLPRPRRPTGRREGNRKGRCGVAYRLSVSVRYLGLYLDHFHFSLPSLLG